MSKTKLSQKKSGVLERDGSDKAGYWRILNSLFRKNPCGLNITESIEN
jgi:hypothetical protein